MTFGSPFMRRLHAEACYASSVERGIENHLAGTSAGSLPTLISRSRSTAHSMQRPQPEPTPSFAVSSSTEQAPERAHSRTCRSVIALHRQMYIWAEIVLKRESLSTEAKG